MMDATSGGTGQGDAANDPAERCRRARAALRAAGDLSTQATAADVERVVVILASSRGMSSFLFNLLRSTGSFTSLIGEHIHLYKMFGLLRPDADDAVVDAPGGDRAGFAAALLDDLTIPDPEPVAERTRIQRLARQLAGQWHERLPPIEVVVGAIERAMAALRDQRDPELHFLHVVRQLRRAEMPIDPWYYDLPADKVAAVFPELARPAGPPALSDVIEEPPFVLPAVGRAATRADLRARPLLLKSSSDAYRVAELAKLFPAARITYVHLTRNPAASINGLVDGWLHRGFFSRRLPADRALAIPGYSEQPWGTRWWKFDLPPGWEAMRARPLPEVAAFQWSAAHAAILAALPALDPASIVTVRAEALIEDGSRRAELARILTHAGASADHALRAQPKMVMSTVAPKPGRWRDRQDVLATATSSPRVLQIASALGYGDRPGSAWI
ncbi:MAG TPA: hypothetical protein VFP84_04090 [Kofleriaceae bacterium]|nr:hypothetical protein [Kofleriaceae bacterium]